MDSNPFAGVTHGGTMKSTVRQEGYRDDEAITILTAALHYRRRGREALALAEAKRWMPWLCALTGARITELCQLRKMDIVERDGAMCFHITGDAGSIKNGESDRLVPLHRQLIDQGFLAFAASKPDGPLFAGPGAGRDKAIGSGMARAEKIGVKLARWVRDDLGMKDASLAPSHGWRHRFSTLRRKHGIEFEAGERLLGHKVPGMSGSYGCSIWR